MIMNTNPHYFFAVRLPFQVKENLNNICENIKVDFPFKSWVHKEDYHITLAFLGGVPKDKLALAKENVAARIQNQSSFPLTIDHLGVFGKKESPRIFWAGLEKEKRLDDLRAKVFRSCTEAGFSLETRPFSPHITLARKWMESRPFSQNDLNRLDLFKENVVNFLANEVVLYQTHLQQVPKYEAISVYKLMNN